MERDYSYVMTGPEIELIEVIRLAHMARFNAVIGQADGTFTVKLTDRDSGRFVEGRGETFENAWRAMHHPDLAGLDLNLCEKIAARGMRLADRLAVVDGGFRP